MNKPICVLESFPVGDSTQWALIRGADQDLPVLLVLQAGPGFPIIHDADALEGLLHWEQEFVVVYWDQRGCGKSFGALQPHAGLSLAQCVADTAQMIKNLQDRMNTTRIFLLGFSLGATIGALAAHESFDALHAFVGVGMDVDLPKADKDAYAFIHKVAQERGNHRALRDLVVTIGAGPVTDAKRFLLRAKWLMEFGGIHRGWTYRKLLFRQIHNIIRSPHYTMRNMVEALKGMRRVPDLMLNEVASINLFESLHQLSVPVYFFQGRHDPLASADVAERYFERLEAPRGKELIWFESSAHMPHYEEPDVFMATLLAVKGRAKNLPTK